MHIGIGDREPPRNGTAPIVITPLPARPDKPMIANLLIAGTVILLVTGVVSLKTVRAVRRTREMGALARRMGWSFEPQPAMDVVPNRKRLGLFTVQMHQRIRNHLSGAVGEYRVAVFDLAYSTTRDEGVRGWEQTVVQVQSTRLRLPSFALRPERIFHRAGDGVGGGDIDFGADPEFSRAYQLRGPDEAAIRAAFGDDVRAAFHRGPASSADADGSDFFFWRRGQVARPDEVCALVQAAIEHATRLRNSAAYQISGHANGNHGFRPAARRVGSRGKQDFYDLF
jgi:hypothetical protein